MILFHYCDCGLLHTHNKVRVHENGLNFNQNISAMCSSFKMNGSLSTWPRTNFIYQSIFVTCFVRKILRLYCLYNYQQNGALGSTNKNKFYNKHEESAWENDGILSLCCPLRAKISCRCILWSECQIRNRPHSIISQNINTKFYIYSHIGRP